MNFPEHYPMLSSPPPLVEDSEEQLFSMESLEDMDSAENISPISVLSDEVLVLIFQHLPLSSFCSTACTSKNWKKLIFDQFTLKHLVSRMMPDTLKRIEAKRLLRDRVARGGKNKRRMVDQDYLHCLKTEAKMRSAQNPTEIKELKGHTKSVFCLNTTEDGTLLSGSGDGTVRIWFLESDEPTILNLNDSILDMQIEEDNFYFRGNRGQIHVWGRKEGEEVALLNPNLPFSSFQVSGDLVYCGSKSGSIEIFDINANTTITSLKSGSSSSVTSLFVSDRVYAGCNDGTLRILDIETGRILQDFKGHTGMVKNFSVLEDRRIYSGSFDQTICTWDVRSKFPVSVIYFDDYVSCLEVVDNKIGSGSWDGLIRYFDMRSERLLKTLEHTICVMSLHSNAGFVYSGSMGSDIRLWDFNA